MALLDFVKNIQLRANQGTPYGEMLMSERQQEQKMMALQQQQQQEAMAQQQRAQAIASALPEQLQGFSGLVLATGEVDPALDLFKAQQDAELMRQQIAAKQAQQRSIDQNRAFQQQMVDQMLGGGQVQTQDSSPIATDTDALSRMESMIMQLAPLTAEKGPMGALAEQRVKLLQSRIDEMRDRAQMSPTTKTNLEAKTQAASGVYKTVQKLRPLISDENVGLLGSARNTLQNLGEQGRAISGYLRDVESDSVQYLRSRQDEIDQGYLFDPELPAVEALSRNLAYQVAVQRKGGGRLNIQDVENAKQEVGLSGLASGRSVGVKLDLLEDEARDTAASAFEELGRKAPEWVVLKPKGNQEAAQPRRIIYNAQGQRVSQ